MSIKRKVLKIIFWLSFAPYLFLIVYSIYHAIFGYDMYTLIFREYIRTIYGWEAFLNVFVWNAFILCVYPVLPVCLLYQVIYFIVWLIKRILANRT